MARCEDRHPGTGERCSKEAGHDGRHGLPAAHRCHAEGCLGRVPPTMLMCARHWRLVPKDLQRAVHAAYRRGQCDDMDPSEAWHVAADAAIGHVSIGEHGRATVAQVAALRAHGYETSVDLAGDLMVRAVGRER